MTKPITRRHAAAVLAGASAVIGRGARAETDTVRMALPYGLVYLPSMVVAEREMIQKHARAAGLGEVKLAITRTSSGPVGTDLLLSGQADLAQGGDGPMLTVWDKTRGAQKVRGVVTLCASPILLLTNDPRIRTIADYRAGDRIAVSAIKVTDQAMMLQMAAAKFLGWDRRFELDQYTVSISNPDALTAMLSGGSEIRNHATIVPFTVLEMESGKVRQVLSSADLQGHTPTTAVLYAPERFRAGHPKTYAAVVAAYEEAFDLIRNDPMEAARIYVKWEPQPRNVEWIRDIIGDASKIAYGAVPTGVLAHATFMNKIGILKNGPTSWKEMFWENLHDKDGS